jgi:hypothetical protein
MHVRLRTETLDPPVQACAAGRCGSPHFGTAWAKGELGNAWMVLFALAPLLPSAHAEDPRSVLPERRHVAIEPVLDSEFLAF